MADNSLSDYPGDRSWECHWWGQPQGTLSAARNTVLRAAQICIQSHADKTVSWNAEAADIPRFVSVFHLFFQSSQMAGFVLAC